MDTSTYNIHHPELIKEKFAEIIALNVSGNTARRGKKKGKLWINQGEWKTLWMRGTTSPPPNTQALCTTLKKGEKNTS